MYDSDLQQETLTGNLYPPAPPCSAPCTLLPTASPTAITPSTFRTTTTHLLPNTRILSQPTTLAKPAALGFRLWIDPDTRKMEPLGLALRSVAPDHLAKVDVPAEAVQLIIVWVDDIRRRRDICGRGIFGYC